jgi:hypothetical protein
VGKQADGALAKTTGRHIPEGAKSAAAKGLGIGYGVAFGALYAALCRCPGKALLGGPALGLGAWAAGYLGWLPALGLTPPVRKQTFPQIAGPVVDHLAYGIVTAATYDWLSAGSARRGLDPLLGKDHAPSAAWCGSRHPIAAAWAGVGVQSAGKGLSRWKQSTLPGNRLLVPWR